MANACEHPGCRGQSLDRNGADLLWNRALHPSRVLTWRAGYPSHRVVGTPATRVGMSDRHTADRVWDRDAWQEVRQLWWHVRGITHAAAYSRSVRPSVASRGQRFRGNNGDQLRGRHAALCRDHALDYEGDPGFGTTTGGRDHCLSRGHPDPDARFEPSLFAPEVTLRRSGPQRSCRPAPPG